MDKYYVMTQARNYDDFYTGGNFESARALASEGDYQEYYPMDDSVSKAFAGNLLKCPEFLIFEQFPELIKDFDADGFELVPVKVKCDADVFEIYHLVNFPEPIECFDAKNSVFDEILLSIHGLEKLVLDEEKLSNIPESKKQFFCMKESKKIKLVSEKFKDHLIESYKARFGLKLRDIAFIPVSEYKG